MPDKKKETLFNDDEYMRIFNRMANGMRCMLEQKDDILSLLEKYGIDQLDSYRIVELGCGYGDKLEFFLNNFLKNGTLEWYTGYDYSQVSIDRNNALYKNDSRLRFEFKDITQPETFSNINANFVYDWWGASYSGVEHSLRAAYKLLAPGGYYLLANWRGGIDVPDLMHRQTLAEIKRVRSWKSLTGLIAGTQLKIKGYTSFVEGVVFPSPEEVPEILESNDFLPIHVGTCFCEDSNLLVLAQKKYKN